MRIAYLTRPYPGLTGFFNPILVKHQKQTIEFLEDEIGRLLDPAVFAALKRVVLRRKTLTFIDDMHA